MNYRSAADSDFFYLTTALIAILPPVPQGFSFCLPVTEGKLVLTCKPVLCRREGKILSTLIEVTITKRVNKFPCLHKASKLSTFFILRCNRQVFLHEIAYTENKMFAVVTIAFILLNSINLGSNIFFYLLLNK